MTETFTWRRTMPLAADPSAALQRATARLEAVGFAVRRSGEGRLLADGPGWRSSRQSALRAASRLDLRAGDGSLRVEARLDGLRALTRYVRWFPLLLLLGLGVLLAVVFRFVMPPDSPALIITALVVVVDLVVWWPLSGRMAGNLARRASAALEAFLAEVAGGPACHKEGGRP